MKPALKLKHVLTTLLDADTTGLTKLDVVTPYHGCQLRHFSRQFWSCCLNTHISAMDNTGVVVSRRNESYINQNGTQKQKNPRLLFFSDQSNRCTCAPSTEEGGAK